MTAIALLPRLRFRLGDGDEKDDVLLEILEGCIQTVKALTWSRSLPEEMGTLVVKMAVIAYNQMGLEGEASRTEGNAARVLKAMPEDIAKEIMAFRKARVGC